MRRSPSLAQMTRSAPWATSRSPAMRSSGSRSLRWERFFASPSVWNMMTCGTVRRAGIDLDDARALIDLDHVGRVGVDTAGEDVQRVGAPAELAAQLPDVD